MVLNTSVPVDAADMIMISVGVILHEASMQL